MFPLPCGAGSTVPREGFDSSVIMIFSVVGCGCDTSYIVSVHIQCQASIYTVLLCRGHSWRVRLAKQETLTPPGHLWFAGVCECPPGALLLVPQWKCISSFVFYTCVCVAGLCCKCLLPFSTFLGLLYDMANPMVVCLMYI